MDPDPSIQVLLTSLLTLTAMEIVLGIDNIIFISLLSDKLPEQKRKLAQRLGLIGAFTSRMALLSLAFWITQLNHALFKVGNVEITAKGLMMLVGGAFLLYKATSEIHHKIKDIETKEQSVQAKAVFSSVILQIVVMDVVFSLDSVITAVGMTPNLWVMVVANAIALGVMLWAAPNISQFVNKNPSIKMLALSFLILIGTLLVSEGVGFHFPKGYIYFAMFFSTCVEFLNIRADARRKKV